MYEEEAQIGNLIGLFGGFTLFIAIIGLIGMVTYSVERRKKEIGIRKVLGASAFEIFLMFNKQYAILGLIAFVISIPISWKSLDNWLENFAFRVDLGPTIFIVSGGIVILLAAVSVAYLSLSAASMQPSEVLKDE
jgi:putative ABC transport system permease protein